MAVFIIPTHRNVEKALQSLLKEVRIAESITNKKQKILIIDNGSKEIYDYNNKVIDQYRRQEIDIYHIGLKTQEQLVRIISQSIDIPYEQAVELLFPAKVDYGKIFNMSYLFTILLGEDSFHRRDSDCFVDKMEITEYPISKEIRYLGQSINKMKNEIQVIEHIDYSDHEEIVITGSDYFGNWNLDVEDLQKENPETVKSLLFLMGIPKDEINGFLAYKYSEKKEEREGKPILKNSFLVQRSPEAGNISMKEIFKWIPNFVGEHGIGFDYHTSRMSFLFKAPIVYHPNKIIHKHDNTRKNIETLKKYWMGIFKQLDYDIVLTDFIQNRLNCINEKYGSGLAAIRVISEEVLPDEYNKSVKSLDRIQRENTFSELIGKILRPSSIAEYQLVADYLELNKNSIFDQLDKDYENSIFLQRKWSKIVNSVSNVGTSILNQ